MNFKNKQAMKTIQEYTRTRDLQNLGFTTDDDGKIWTLAEPEVEVAIWDINNMTNTEWSYFYIKVGKAIDNL